MRSDQAVLLQLFAQCIAVDAQHLAGNGLIHIGFGHDDFQHRALHCGQHHVLNSLGILAFQIVEKLVQVQSNAI